MSRARAKGTAFETLVLEGFQTRWPDAHRIGMQGSADKGDLWLPGSTNLVVEAKCESSYAGKLSSWLVEAYAEAGNANRFFPVVVHKRRGKGAWHDQYVTMDLGTFLGLVPR